MIRYSLYRPGDYGSMVNEVVSTGEWDDSRSLVETWRGRNANPAAFQNVVGRLLEAARWGLWSTDEATLRKLRDLYGDAGDRIEDGTGTGAACGRDTWAGGRGPVSAGR
jgi:cobalamin biosynthesis Mg chelatase CobN